MEKAESDRLIEVFLPMTDRETRSVIFTFRRLYRGFVRDFAESLGVPNERFEYTLINQIQAHIASLREPVFQCMGCGELAEGEGLRWKKLEDGEPLAVSIDNSGKPATLNWLTDKIIMDEWFKPWTDHNPRVQFKLLTSGKGDCHIKFEPIDGPNGTLAFVWQPAGDAEYMEASGELSGDMIVDSSERVWPQALMNEAGKHEVGHVLGIGHLDQTIDVMYPSARGVQKPLSNNDKREIDTRHPNVPA